MIGFSKRTPPFFGSRARKRYTYFPFATLLDLALRFFLYASWFEDERHGGRRWSVTLEWRLSGFASSVYKAEADRAEEVIWWDEVAKEREKRVEGRRGFDTPYSTLRHDVFPCFYWAGLGCTFWLALGRAEYDILCIFTMFA